MPVATTRKVAVTPENTDCATGCEVMTGAVVGVGVVPPPTVSVALPLVALPPLVLVTTTE